MFDSLCLEQPKLRKDVIAVEQGDQVTLNYRMQGCALEFGEDASEGLRLMNLLQGGGASLEDLQSKCPGISDQIPDIVEQLDVLGLLTDSNFAPTQRSMSGMQAYREIRRFAEMMKTRSVRSVFYQSLLAGTTTREQMIGYVLEYYHMVRQAPGLIAPSLSHAENRATREILQRFMAEEIGHDRIMEVSLLAVGFSKEELEWVQPLPTTLGILATLGTLGRQHPISFKGCLFLFEELYQEFNQAFLAQAQKLDLPEKFYKPVLHHSGINEEGSHDEISANLLRELEVVSEEDLRTAKINIGCLIESIARQDQEVFEFYSKPDSHRTRIFL